ncbi:hypothetical protein Gohar_013441, partial [Gossypium harknessii]|nr:hypothetical protein [Gossypium harknessii]
MVRDYPKKYVLSTIEGDDESNRATIRLGSMLRSIEAQRVRVIEKKPMKCFLCCGPHRIQDCPERYKMSIVTKEDEVEPE